MNHHLHLFNFYHESHEPKYIENNLTRAFALCLKHDAVLLYAFLKEILTVEDSNYLFYAHEQDASIQFDMQVETSHLVDDTKKLYAIGLTDGPINEDWSGIATDIVPVDKLNITDLVITLKDIKIIIEVKRTGEDCKEQLRQQIAPFIGERVIPITARHLSWSYVLNTIEQVSHFYTYNGQSNQFINSFLQLVKVRFNHWIPTKPFKYLQFFKDNSETSKRHDMNKRLMQAVQSIGNENIDFLWDRTAIKVNRNWASEAIPEFIKDTDGKDYLKMDIWPGNIKQQGYSLYSMPLDWTKNETLLVNHVKYQLNIERHIKFMHWNKYISSIDIAMKDTDEYLEREINTQANLHDISGKWNRPDWPKLDDVLNDYFKNFNWKDECGWEENFENSDRNYLTMSLGYCVRLYIPYEVIQEMDTMPDGFKKVGIFLQQCKDAIVNMIEGK